MSKPMSGVKVVEVAMWWFVPAAAAILSDWGAEVIKVEHPVSGDPQRGLMTGGLLPDAGGGFNFMAEQPNRGKRSIGIDIGKPNGRELLYKLVAEADVFVTSFLPDARRRLGIDVEDIRRVNPNIIFVRGSGQGAEGPDAEKGGYDAASFWSRGGLGASLTQPGATAPVFQRAAFGDSIGAMTLAGGVAAALFERERTGVAPVVDVSLFGTAMWVLAPDIIASAVMEGGIPSFARTEAPNPLVNTYQTSDGRWLTLLLLQPDRYWEDFCGRVGRTDLLTDERFSDGMNRFMNRAELVAILDEAFGSKTLAEWREILETHEGPWAPMQTAAEVLADPQAAANGYLSKLDPTGANPAVLVANPVQFDGEHVQLTSAPQHGQHTEEVLLELGLTWDDLIKFKEEGAIL